MKPEAPFGLENATWPAFLLDASGIIRRASVGAKALFGPGVEAASSLGAVIWSNENSLSAEQVLSRSESGTFTSGVLSFRIKDGTVRKMEASCCWLSKDDQKYCILQLREPIASASGKNDSAVEAGLAQKQKLDCALQLTRTVALDFNNALTSILVHTSHILGKMEGSHPWRTALVEVEKSAEKAAEIANDLASFSRQEKDARTHVAGNLNDLLRRTVELFQAPGNPKIEWSTKFEHRLYTVQFDEAKMQQAFVKLIENAVQAVGPNGLIEVRTHNLDAPDGFQDGAAHIKSGYYLVTEIIDNGCGITPEIMPRIFEPFFTTKQAGKHRGLGLAWVYGIVTNHGGVVAVSSQAGQGTTVRVYLPAQKKVLKDFSAPETQPTGTQTILMIDDEDLLLTMGQMVLSSFGYEVLTANSGQKGLEIFERERDKIDLVITDLVMPQMSGRELMERMRRISPEVKIICASGFARPSGVEDDETYLQKPFTSQELLRRVRSVLAC